MKIRHFFLTMIGCVALAQNASFAAPSSLASDGKDASEVAENLQPSKSGAAAKEKSAANENTKALAPAVPPRSVISPAGQSLKNAPNRGSSPAIIGGPADSRKNAAALVGGTAKPAGKTTVVDGTAVNRKR